GRADRAADIRRAGTWESTSFQIVELAKRDAPDDRCPIDVDGDQLAERRHRARNAILWIPEAADRPPPRRRTLIFGLARRLVRPPFESRDLTEVHDVREDEAARRVVRQAAPVAAAERAGKSHHRPFDFWRREHAPRVHPVLVPELAAVGGMLWRQGVEVAGR